MGRSTAPCAAGEWDRIGVVPTNGFQNRVREVGHGRASSCEADRIETRNWSKRDVVSGQRRALPPVTIMAPLRLMSCLQSRLRIPLRLRTTAVVRTQPARLNASTNHSVAPWAIQ